MAVVYFSSNAAIGAGSLAEAVKNASPGDAVRPDETVFERGSTIEIVLASRLNVDKNLTLDGGPFRVRLNGGGSVGCVVVASGAVAEFTAFEFVFGQTGSGGGAQVLANASATFNRCLFAGCGASYGGAVNASAGTTVALNDCVVVGCRGVESGGGVLSAGALNLNGVTAVGCASGRRSDVSVYGGGVLTARNSILGNVVNTTTAPSTFLGSVVDVASSNVGFVASPPDGLSVDNWGANAWENWDLRLLDDMSPNQSPYRDSGDVGAMSQYDFQGCFRGRETNGATSCSPGAYETIQADLFWIGRDATGAEVETPSWFASDGWAASRFATVSGDKAPQSSDSVFVDGAIVLESNALQLKKLTVGGAASLTLDDSASAASQNMRVGQIDLGVGATVSRVADKQRLQISNPSAVSRFGDYSYTASLFFWNNAEALSIAPTAKFTSVVSSVKLYNTGIYNAYNLQVSDVATLEGDSTGCVGVYITFLKPTARLDVAGAARVFCNEFKWITPSDATSDFKGLADDSTPIVFAPSRAATVDGVGSVDDFIVDVSNARTTGTLALTLSGQTVCGDAPTGAAVSLTGSAKIADRDLTSPTFSVGAGSSLAVNGASVNVGTLALNADSELTVEKSGLNVEALNASGAELRFVASTLTATTLELSVGSSLAVNGASVCVKALTVADGANVAFSPAESQGATNEANANATASTVATYVDAVLAATESATVGAASFSGVGYFATPTATDASAATFAETVRRAEVGANVETFAATATGPTTAKLEWSATDATKPVYVERQNAAAPNGWEVVAFATAAESPLIVALSGSERF